MRTKYYVLAVLALVAALIAGLVDFRAFLLADPTTIVTKDARPFLTLGLVAWAITALSVSTPPVSPANPSLFLSERSTQYAERCLAASREW